MRILDKEEVLQDIILIGGWCHPKLYANRANSYEFRLARDAI